MGTFPIQYSQKLPPAVGPNVRANLDVSTGAGEIGAGISAIGGAIFEIGANLKAANRAVELSTMKRKHDTILQSAYFAAQTADPETIPDLWEKAKKDAEALSSKDLKVNQMYQIWHNDNIGTWNERTANLHQETLKKNLYDQQMVNVQTDMENGKVRDAATKLAVLAKLFPKEKVKFEQLIVDLPNNIRLARARIEIDRDPEKAIAILDALDNPTAEQLDEKDKLKRMAQQKSAINTDQIENEIVFGMFDNKDKTLVEKEKLGQSYINKLRTTSGLSAESARVMTTRVENWMTGKARINDSLVYTKLFRDVTQLHRGIGQTDNVRREIRGSFDNLDDSHFESLNKYLDETVEEWNADTLRRLEKEAIPHLAPRLAMIEKWMEMAATPGISAKQKAKYDSLIERLQEPAKVDADRLALYLNQSRKWIAANPTAPNFYENGRRIMAQFERYTDDQIRQMEKQLESDASIELPKMTGEIKSEIPTIKSDTEYDALPIGTVYQDPSGKLRRKR